MVTAWKADLGTKKVGHHCSNWKQYIGKNLSCWSRARIVVYWSVFTLPRSWGKNVRFPAEAHTFQIHCGLAHGKYGGLLHCTNCRSMQPFAVVAVVRLQCWWNLAKCISSNRQILPSKNFPFNRKQSAFAPKYSFQCCGGGTSQYMPYSKSSSTLTLDNSTRDCDSALIQAIEKIWLLFCLRLTCQRQCCNMGNLRCQPIHRATVFVFVTP